ncbi:MAG TPA: selenide, water dikinase SelD [Pseudobdellovibrionaceae bacterium]|nr:selenide, water dikinase SelD [Pseudobdellovibrionaceae bacterium]
MEKIALTQTVQKGGCAAKVAASELRRILSNVRFPAPHPELLVDGGLFDDAAVYKVSDDLALVQTLDFFTPILDSPRSFGAVAAANALSDVYAMGGRPKTALGILAFPLASEVIVEIHQGASDKIAEAGANFVGGHSIDDETLKFGLSVTGFVHPDRVWSNSKARVGDHLILTKGLGTGTLTAALKRREMTEDGLREAIESMSRLNNAVDALDDRELESVHAATDVTGFGLSGHGFQMAQASQVSLIVDVSRLPVLSGAMECLERGFLTKAHRSNALYTENECEVGTLSAIQKQLIHDPQTSGGLLLAVSPESSEALVHKLRRSFPRTSLIGEVVSKKEKAVVFES